MTNAKNYNPLLDPRTKDYVIVQGNTVKDYTLQFAAYVRLMVQKKTWLYATDESFGSDLAKVKKRSGNTPRLLESITTKALQPLLDDNRAKDIVIVSKPQARNMCNIVVSILEANNQIQQFEFNPVE